MHSVPNSASFSFRLLLFNFENSVTNTPAILLSFSHCTFSVNA